jgi:hypothetical protein
VANKFENVQYINSKYYYLQCRADHGKRLCTKSTKRFFDKRVNHFAALWRNLQKRKLILHIIVSTLGRRYTEIIHEVRFMK